MGKIQTLIPEWEADQSRCQAIMFQVHELERYGVLKFLSENPMKVVDSCLLFILKSNMGWKDSIYKVAIEEMWTMECGVTRMHKEILKDMQIINPKVSYNLMMATWIPIR